MADIYDYDAHTQPGDMSYDQAEQAANDHVEPVDWAHVHVDVIESGRALVTGPNFSGRIYREHGSLHVEDTDSEKYIGHGRTYASVAQTLARHHGLADGRFTVHVEREN